MNSEGAGEDGSAVGDSPFQKLFVDCRRRILNYQRREALLVNADGGGGTGSFNGVDALSCPPKNVFAEEQEHTDFLVATEEHPAPEFFLAIDGKINTAVFIKPLKCERRS